jgi:ATP-dependent DNA helicase DinG
MRSEIHHSNGNEVFFSGNVNSSGVIEKIRVCARGHQNAVTAVFEQLQLREVVIHNHPSGNLTPSEADLELSVVFSRNGHGVYIVDNDVANVYVVIEPFFPSEAQRLDSAALKDIFESSKGMTKVIDDYEYRPQQLEMMESIADAFNNESISVIEAPTGVGKTLAYLVPAVHWAVENKSRVVISTRTINLQEQILFKDIPLLQKVIGADFSVALVKGRNNYLCRKRLDKELSEVTLFDENNEKDVLKSIWEWSEKTTDGSLAELPFSPPPELWERICSDADSCTASICYGTKNCFLTKARREVAKADIIIVNHHLLFSDLSIKKELGNFNALGVLPSFDRLIMDEAHHIEDAATEYFGAMASQFGVNQTLGRFLRKERGKERGLIPYITQILLKDFPMIAKIEQDEVLDLLHEIKETHIPSFKESMILAFQMVRSLAAEQTNQIGKNIKWRLTDEIMDSVEIQDLQKEQFLPNATECQNLAAKLLALHRKLIQLPVSPDLEEHPLAMELAQIKSGQDRLTRIALFLSEFLQKTEELTYVKWVEIDSEKSHIVRLKQSPLDIGKSLSEWVYPNINTGVAVSATLAVDHRFDFFFKQVGLSNYKEKTVEALQLDSPFDFSTQSLLCLPTDLPEPNDPNYIDSIAQHILEILLITQGKAFILFTSFYVLNQVHSKIQNELSQSGITSLKQGELPRHQLLERFRHDVHSVLFGTESFWEGVDIAGESLECVIIPKLPFRVPTEPILEARVEKIEADGGNSFMEYALPLAAIKLRQGTGRLIRKKTDKGVVIILDTRIHSKFYGKTFIHTLPPMKRVKGTAHAILMTLEKFFTNHKE